MGYLLDHKHHGRVSTKGDFGTFLPSLLDMNCIRLAAMSIKGDAEFLRGAFHEISEGTLDGSRVGLRRRWGSTRGSTTHHLSQQVTQVDVGTSTASKHVAEVVALL